MGRDLTAAQLGQFVSVAIVELMAMLVKTQITAAA